MAKLLKLRRGTTTQHNTFTGAEGEITIDITKDTVVVHDGTTAGGHPLLRQDQSNLPVGTALTNGLYLPAANSVAISTNSTGRLAIDSSGNVNIDSGTVYVDAVNNRLGIGTTTMSYAKFNVYNDTNDGTYAVKIQGVFGNSDYLDSDAANNFGNGLSETQFLNGTSSRPAMLSLGGSLNTGEAMGVINFFRSGNSDNYRSRVQLYGGVQSTGTAGQHGGFLAFLTAEDGAANPTERMRITSAGRVGIGTTAPTAATHIMLSDVAGFNSPLIDGLVVERSGGNDLGITIATDNSRNGYLLFADSNSSNPAWISYDHSADAMSFRVNANERARIDSSGRLLVGTSSALSDGGDIQLVNASGRARFHRNAADEFQSILWLSKARGTGYQVLSNNDKIGSISFQGADGTVLLQAAAISAEVDGTPGASDMPGRLVFSTTADGASSPTERMRIRNDGQIWCYSSAGGIFSGVSASAGTTTATFIGQHSATGVNNGTNSFIVWSNGNVVNTNNSYGSISDIKLKENIVDASSQWNDIKALRPVNYNFKEGQTHTQLGLIAQEVELVSPGLVSESPDRDAEGNDLGTVTKSVNYSVLYMKAVKALQEAMERIETLEASNADLLARVTALESA
jgi:hypothetical protein